ncbi:TPA: integrating conjugative element protein [Legionella pneumophila]|nr:integrating conjugative element protein [Legionella pneumophila]HBD7333472.1 integrating conjugative element protein [Legionella pneumophila]HCC0305865.1 integrating conjugative element protein [Legionella pneumophila]HCW6744054.1 integrating conjugative element protein [Legionella pneumophila]HDV6625257.1 integrating conjugative element protein [Legionella pneumophila]
MLRILFLLLFTFHAYSMNVIPLTLVQSDNAMQLNLSSPIGVPVKSKATVGKVNRKNIPSNLININLFIIGADRLSYKWLEAHQKELKSMQALGFITNVNDFKTIVALQDKFKLPVLPVNVDPLLDFVHEHHYPLIIAEGALWQ